MGLGRRYGNHCIPAIRCNGRTSPARFGPLVRTKQAIAHADGASGTAEITTTACAMGPSSVTVTSMRALKPAGVMALSRASAPPVSSWSAGPTAD